MKKSASLNEPIAGSVRKINPRIVTTAKAAKPPPVARAKAVKPARLLEEHFPNSEAHSVAFEYFNPAASEVFLAGTFNNWQPRTTSMTKQHGGKWSTQLLLKPGQYEYRLIVDGQWQDDPMAARFVANPFGGLNCVVEVHKLEA
jgi:1,4-alpha-glucan branching enzyme